MKFVELFNISSPETLEFSFSGKAAPLGRKFTWWWHKSEFIITNKRFIIGSLTLMYYKQLYIMIIPLEHIREVIQKKNQLHIKFQTFPDEFLHSDVRTLRIQISEREELRYEEKYNKSLKDAVQYYLSRPEA